jgi:hypothetical protein
MIDMSSRCIHYPTSVIINVPHCVMLRCSRHGLSQMEGLSSPLFNTGLRTPRSERHRTLCISKLKNWRKVTSNTTHTFAN